MKLDIVVERLSRHAQRATYAAVGGVVGRIAIAVMHGRPKNHENSWVVAQNKKGEPTGFTAEERDPRFPGQGEPINTADGLRQWLDAHE